MPGNETFSDSYISFGQNYRGIRVIESPGKISFVDARDKRAFELTGGFDAAAVKKDIEAKFKGSSLPVSASDISYHISTQSNNENSIYKNLEKKDIYSHQFNDYEKNIPKPSAAKISKEPDDKSFDKQIEAAKKAGYVQGVCECLALVGGDKAMSNKILTQMNVTKDMAKKYASPETYRALERTVFAPKQEHAVEIKRGRGL